MRESWSRTGRGLTSTEKVIDINSKSLLDMRIEDLHSEIVRQLEERVNHEIASKKIAKAKYFGIMISSHGLRDEEEKELIEGHLDSFGRLRLEARLQLAKMFYASDFSEQANLGDAILQLGIEELTPAHFDSLDGIASVLQNWGQADWFSIRIVQPLLRKYPKQTLNLLREWNSSENQWKRRASVVTFTRKIGMSGEFIDEALELCDNLTWDKQDCVRKGVGWALKDNIVEQRRKCLTT